MSTNGNGININGNESGQDAILIPSDLFFYLERGECSVTIPAPLDPLSTSVHGFPRVPFRTRLPGVLAFLVDPDSPDGSISIRLVYQDGATPLTGDLITNSLSYWRHVMRTRYADAGFEASLDAFIDLFSRSEPDEAGEMPFSPSSFDVAFNALNDADFNTEVSRVVDFVAFTIESNALVMAGSRPGDRIIVPGACAFREHMMIRMMRRLKAHPLVPAFTRINILPHIASDLSVDAELLDAGLSIGTKQTLVLIDMISVAQGADMEGISFHEAAGRVLAAIREISQTLIDVTNDQSAIESSLVLGGSETGSHFRVSLAPDYQYGPSSLLRKFVRGHDGIIDRILEQEPALRGSPILSMFKFVCEVTIWSALNGSGSIYCKYDSAGQRSIPSDLFFDWFSTEGFRAPGNIEIPEDQLPSYRYLLDVVNDYEGGWSALRTGVARLRQAISAASLEWVPLDQEFMIKTPHAEQTGRLVTLLSEQDALELILDAATALWPEDVDSHHVSIVNSVDRNAGSDHPYREPYLRIDADGNEWLPRLGVLGAIFNSLSSPSYRKSDDYSRPERLMDMIADKAEEEIAFRSAADMAFRELAIGVISLMPGAGCCVDIIEAAGLPAGAVSRNASDGAGDWTARALTAFFHVTRMVCTLIECGALPLMPGRHTHASYVLKYIGMDEIHNLFAMLEQRNLDWINRLELTSLIMALPGDEDATVDTVEGSEASRKRRRDFQHQKDSAEFEKGEMPLTGTRRTHYGYIEMQLIQPLKTMIELGY